MALLHPLQPHRLIVSTGDTSDFDGFLSLILYALVPNADIMYIMNFPAIFNPKALGIPTSFTAHPSECSEFGKGFQWTTPNPQDDLASFRSKFFDYIRRIWPEHVPNKLFVVDGGLNDINIFAPGSNKLDEKVYESVLRNISIPKSDPIPDVDDYEEVFVDMNGSMAFYDHTNSELFDWMQKLFESGKFKALHMSGGVLDDEIPQTVSAFRSKPNYGINRLSCATLNQLYAPTKTMSFLDDCKANSIPIILVTNNLISNNFTFTDYSDFKTAMQPILSASNELFRCGFEAYYKESKTQKAFDVVTSLSLIGNMLSCKPNLQSTTAHLFFNTDYGITLVSKDTPSSSKAIINYTVQLEAKIGLSRADQTLTTIESFSKELELVRSSKLKFTTYTVSNVAGTRDQIIDMITALT